MRFLHACHALDERRHGLSFSGLARERETRTMIKSVLIPLTEAGSLGSILHTGMLLASRFEAHVDGVYVRAEPSVVLASDDTGATTPALIESFEREDAARAARLQARFREEMAGSDLPEARWRCREITAEGAGLGGHGRLFDVIVVGRPGRAADAPSMTTLETALFDTGRVILIAPPNAPETLGERVVIAWNGSSETARTVAFGLPLLAAASEVTIVTVDTGFVPGPSGRDLAAYLARAGIAAEAVDVQAGRRGPGEAMLEEAHRHRADLMVKGGYTRSRLRQAIFGGATSHILANAELPVLMAH
jgi:nucleotide-binding universal stress UspA family protein